MPPKILTMAGSDASGGAGQLADLKVFEEFGTFGQVALTCIVTMDPNDNFRPSIYEIPDEIFEKQCQTAFVDHDISTIKTGMLFSESKIKLAHKFLTEENIKNIIIDPVMLCKQGDMQLGLKQAIRDYLLPIATITTPNLIEAEALANIKITNLQEMEKAAHQILELGSKSVVIKGGHRLAGDIAYDLYADQKNTILLEKDKLPKNYNHGAGCTFAAAISAALALDYDLIEAVTLAKDFVYAAIKNGFMANRYTGHVWHGAYNQAQKRFRK